MAKNNVLVYGKSNCQWCDQAKLLLESYQYQYQYRNVDVDDGGRIDLKAFFDSNPKMSRTVPQIFIDGKHIGGYSQLAQYIEDTRGGYGDGAF